MIETAQSQKTIGKTLMTTLLMDGFWDRWIAHGLLPSDLKRVRANFTSLANWNKAWTELADEKVMRAEELLQDSSLIETEYMYRLAALYYNLGYWIYPQRDEAKEKLYRTSQTFVYKADSLATTAIHYCEIEVGGYRCEGRMRTPINPQGCIVIINPIDSSKEELFTYEMDFIQAGFATISFDGPGQGAAYTLEGARGTQQRWELLVHQAIEYSKQVFPNQSIHLFGTSSGAAWAIYGSCHPDVTSVVAVSPAVSFKEETVRLPDYFMERLQYVLEGNEGLIPDFSTMQYKNPILLVHGKQDVMVSTQAMYRLYEQLPSSTKLIEFENEGHCCNFELPNVRKQAMAWFQETKQGG